VAVAELCSKIGRDAPGTEKENSLTHNDTNMEQNEKVSFEGIQIEGRQERTPAVTPRFCRGRVAVHSADIH
jgi:hypothetical protein